MYCSNKIYHSNKFGLSRKCTCHDAVHLCFGTISLLLSKTQVSDFARYISELIYNERYYDQDPDMRDIYIPTNDSNLMIVMTYNEVKDLSEILDMTLMGIQIEEALAG